MIRLLSRPQRTLAAAAEVRGVGFLTGADITARFLPADADTGVVFARRDLKSKPRVAAHVGNVGGTARRTTLGKPPFQVALVEHVLAALAGQRIDNCVVELDACEPPGLDGSAAAFVEAIHSVGAVVQDAEREVYCVDEPLSVGRGGATLTLYPPDAEDELRVSYFLDYGDGSPIDRQSHTQIVTPSRVARDVMACRTFLLASEVAEFQAQGIGERLTPADVLVFGPRGPVDNRLRFANEPARHKVLDAIGDLSLCGVDLRGHVVAVRSGHPLNVELARAVAGLVDRPAVLPFRRAA